MSLLVVGTVAFDSIETPFGKKEKILGGAATYTCFTSSYFTNSNIVSIVGYDFPKKHEEKFINHNVDLVGLERHKEIKTFFNGELKEYHKLYLNRCSSCHGKKRNGKKVKYKV